MNISIQAYSSDTRWRSMVGTLGTLGTHQSDLQKYGNGFVDNEYLLGFCHYSWTST